MREGIVQKSEKLFSKRWEIMRLFQDDNLGLLGLTNVGLTKTVINFSCSVICGAPKLRLTVLIFGP